MKQIPLDLSADQPQSFDTFVTGRNEELLQRLQQLATAGADKSAHTASASTDRFLYLWAEAGAGKSHLLHAIAHQAGDQARLIAADAPESAFEYSPQVAHYLIDDADQLGPPAQIAAFNLFNQIREQGGWLVSTGALPPTQLELREDLRTRLGWGLIYQVHGLSDDEKIAALAQAAQGRGLELPPGMLPYLLTHYRRDMPSLSRMLDALDRYSLATKRAITLPLLRDLLQQETEQQ
ncbi:MULTISPECIES: DnaA regulatory inactivator Hda [unclassified Herbaspirillum]|uniref:DnaA regulatory inactivator Hda n=1 Tax=unclassified Herbaspirillum TaxID=2624150 RepID=UPI00114E2F5B|nr:MULTISPECIES: DnaA regulatory inactivator Hda [unclassified Herbaspirillum]MBB5392410.1 DnaA family protein [Herbaspirillum sp. SJZ102]TQK06049.1 regulatory inactivation of DnaA Hda protein [Herbaspirillum sp. SJZ130]TQK12473.1 regulatory inactivation of DnaA Hda protein [Herbaspirillum sp. SJZ106]